MSSIIPADPSFSFLILRLGLAIAFFAHGSQQLLAWFGGRRFMGTLSNWKQKYRIPTPIGAIRIFTEFFGSLALFVGVLTRPFALGLTIFMLVAIQKALWDTAFSWRAARERAAELKDSHYCDFLA
jgi:putative oxidoreductase